MYDREPIPLLRDCEAVLIPAGTEVVIPEGTEVNVAQSLGGSFTVYVGGNLVRIAGKDADALGLEAPELPTLPEDASEADFEALVWDQLKTCFDPEIPINIVDLGLVYECAIDKTDSGYAVRVQMTLTAPGCGMGEVLVADVRDKLKLIPTTETVDVELVFDPPWHHGMMSDAAKLQTGMY